MLEQFRPGILEATRLAWARRSKDGQFIRQGKAEFAAIPDQSIDYAVMEHCPGPVKMVPLDAGWNDLGAWDAVWQVLPKDGSGNALVGDVLAADSQDTLVHAASRLVSLVGVKDHVVIETPDAVLFADKARSQDVRHVVNAPKHQEREEQALHRKVRRPWRWYDSIDEVGRFDLYFTRRSASSSQPGKIPLEIIEMRSGSYLGEDDIVRFDDEYEKAKPDGPDPRHSENLIEKGYHG